MVRQLELSFLLKLKICFLGVSQDPQEKSSRNPRSSGVHRTFAHVGQTDHDLPLWDAVCRICVSGHPTQETCATIDRAGLPGVRFPPPDPQQHERDRTDQGMSALRDRDREEEIDDIGHDLSDLWSLAV